MNSRNMPEEEELDHLFRQAADSFEPEFDPEAWQQMEKKLDDANRPPAVLGTWIKRTLLALLLLISGVAVYYYASRGTVQNSVQIKTSQRDTPALSNSSEQITPEKSASGIQEPLPAKRLEDKALSANLPAAKEQADQPTRLLRRPDTPLLFHQRRSGSSGRSGDKSKQNGLLLSGINNADAVSGNINLKSNAPEENATPLGVAGNQRQSMGSPALLPNTGKSSVDSTANPVELNTAIMPENSSASLDSTQTKSTAVADSTMKRVPATFMSKISVNLVFGPDFSTVRFARPEKASTNVGVLLSYAFNRRWAISTGVVRAKKVYGAKPEDYHPGPNYWPSGQHLPDDINAICKVLDIPLNVRYAIMALPRQVIYVQTGLSSYVMLHEDYRYDYNNYGKPYSKHWIVANKNTHFFQVLNLSVGYSKQIKPGISVGAEPFVKLPLAGIGAGKVNLTSLGAFFTASYRFR